MKTADKIQYLTNILYFNNYVQYTLTDPALGYTNDTTGSDIFNIIQEFLNNDGQAPICGAALYFLVKRYPDEMDISSLVAQLRANHVFVYITAYETGLGGTNREALFEVASKTNGFCVFGDQEYEYRSQDIIYGLDMRSRQFISQQFIVSGAGRIEMPQFQIPNPSRLTGWVFAMVVVKNEVTQSGYNAYLNYTIASLDGTHIFPNPDSYGSSGIFAFPPMKGSTDYKWTIDYNYPTNESQIIEVRMYSDYEHDFLPFNN